MTDQAMFEEKKHPMPQFTVPAEPLRAALIAALAFAEQPDEDYPPILGCVHFEPDGDMVAISATDRYTASREVMKAEGDIFAVRVPSEIAADVVGLITDPADDPYATPGMVTFVHEEQDVTIRVVDRDRTAAISFRPDSMTFPNLEKVFAPAEKVTEEPTAGIHFDAERLARVVSAIKDRCELPIEIAAGGPDKAIVLRQGSDFKALIMSVKVRYHS